MKNKNKSFHAPETRRADSKQGTEAPSRADLERSIRIHKDSQVSVEAILKSGS